MTIQQKIQFTSTNSIEVLGDIILEEEEMDLQVTVDNFALNLMKAGSTPSKHSSIVPLNR